MPEREETTEAYAFLRLSPVIGDKVPYYFLRIKVSPPAWLAFGQDQHVMYRVHKLITTIRKHSPSSSPGLESWITMVLVNPMELG